MGHSHSAIHRSKNSSLEEVVKRAESRAGHISVSGRYHLPPKKLEDDYVVQPKVLGSGYNGEVFMAASKTNADLKFAVKGFRLHGASKEKREELENEAEIFLSLDHPHVARLVDVYETEDRLDLVMECMEGGELFHRVSERKKFTEKDAADAVWQMLLAINYIHSHHVVHRDLKLENFLYEKKNGDHLKLIDFGFSKIWDTNTKMALSCGTLAYVAPEVLDKKYTDQCDMWSLGVITFILLVGYMPFAGSEAHQVRCIKEAKYIVRKEAWKKVSDLAMDFVKKLLLVNPEARLTSAKAIEHPWVKHRDDNFKDHHHVDQDMVNAMVNFSHASQFRRACMSVMAWSLTNEERAKVRDAFLELDTKREGTVKMWEFKQVLEDQFHIDHDEVVAIFEKMNTSHDEEIHYTEFLSAMVSSRIQLHDDLLKATFRRFDTHNTGYITVADLKEVLGESFEGEDITSMLKEAHIDHDGKISLSDFMWYLKHPEADAGHHEVAHKVIDSLTSKGASSNALNPTGSQGLNRGGFMKAKKNGGKDGAAAPAPAGDGAGATEKSASEDKAKAGCKCIVQ
mmetsp:Transcript_61817/g.147483  ORF Transcript_61817/g.147483 Transcript_61817/m.147483 type:complete len:568 (-) Transcript_61817:147-1850(-)